MKAHVKFWVCAAFIALVPGLSNACMPTSTSYFDAPTYLDPDYRIPRWSERKYNQDTMFRLLLSQYIELIGGAPKVADDDARERSQQVEPKQYSDYLQAAGFFRIRYCDTAAKLFDVLRADAEPKRSWWEKLLGISKYSWVKEASTYMIARCHLISAQRNYHGYGRRPYGIDQDELKISDSLYLAYLDEYPKGYYARSARDIRRKIFFLSGQQQLLDQALKDKMLEQFPSSDRLRASTVYGGIVGEFLKHFNGEVDFAHDSPVLVAYDLLGSAIPSRDDLMALEAREHDFAAYPGLFRYVQALAFYKLGDFEGLLQKTAAEAPVKSVMWLSTQLLRERAMAEIGDTGGARSAVRQMYAVSPEDAVALELGVLFLNQHAGLDLFRTSSPISHVGYLRAFAVFGLTDAELKSGIGESNIVGYRRDWLLWELARRLVLSGRFRELVELLNKHEVMPFSSARETFVGLSQDSGDLDAVVAWGEFLADNYITPRYSLHEKREVLEYPNVFVDMTSRCKHCEEVALQKHYNSPLTLFLTVAGIAQESGERCEAEAKALHYIVRSEKLGRAGSRISWHSKPPEGTFQMTGKEAFVRLHKLYKDSPWTEATPYHYTK